jgi:hypothetical protein
MRWNLQPVLYLRRRRIKTERRSERESERLPVGSILLILYLYEFMKKNKKRERK